jgi:hypothetical protein
VVVTETLDWKLHGFDLASEYDKVDEECTLQVRALPALPPARLPKSAR